MPARLRYRPRFLSDFLDQEAWLLEQGERVWLEGFYRAFEEAERMIGRFPEIGVIVRSDERHVSRLLRFPGGLPYLVQYVHARTHPVREVWLVRLLHVRRERPERLGEQ